MREFPIFAESTLRLGAFALSLAAMAAWEAFSPRRARALSRAERWPANLGIVAVNTVVLRLLFPAAVVGAALWAAEAGIGLFNWISAPAWAAFLVTVLVMDAVVFGQHVAFHKVPVLWRLHRMHHMDLDVDFTTGLRFHPVEILISAGIKSVAAVLLGAPTAAVILYEVILNSASIFNHGNVGLPGRLDRALRTLVVTPDMHRVHHSAIRRETDSNYGNALSVWDRLFRTYRPQPRRGHDGMTIGLPQFRTPADGRLLSLILNPLR